MALNNFLLVEDEDSLVYNHLQLALERGAQEGLEDESKFLDVQLDTKYYTADVRLHSFQNLRSLAIWRSKNKDVECKSFCIVLKKSQTTFDLSKLEAITEFFTFDTKMIACFQSCLPPPFSSSLLLWVNKHGFELVDLDPDDSDIEDFKSNNERYSFDRILEVIEGTQWNDKTSKKNPLSQARKNDTIKEETEGSTDEEFDGELDDDEKRFLEELVTGSSILDYYSGRGFDFKNAEGETSQIEDRDAAEKKAKLEARKRANKRAKAKKNDENGDASEDVEIELDREESKEGQKANQTELGDAAEFVGKIHELRKEFASKPREDRVDQAASVATALFKLFEKNL